ncbi:MAG: MATE family efflux transporter [Defluviitaleaceae bacterium]|nr:MATE family efflux transporter [Defluviitaleaceae bacterium]MCL2240248.1 MATE family efflux transporter [Defluviitaleaceae bacterium]
MQSKYNLTEGPIFNKLFRLSLPIMATSLFQTAHTLTNMFWLSWLGEAYVAAAGLAGQFLWLSFALIMIFRIGAEIGVSQNMGRGDADTAKSFAQNGFVLAMLVGAVFTVLVIVFRVYLLRFFNIGNPYVADIAQRYMGIVALALPFNFGHFVITGVFGGFGNTKLPFYINSGALVLNIILSPILIFGFNMGITGAAAAMVAAAAFNFIAKIWAMTRYKNRPFESYAPFVRLAKDKVRQILKWGMPVGVEQILGVLMFMLMTRIIASFGYQSVAAHQVGMQIESLSFMIGGGFASALTAFIGQNYGAKKWGRMRSTFRVSYIFMGMYGIAITAVLFFGATPFVSIFLSEPESIAIGTDYLRIIALAQILFCLEGVATGSFRGRGLTLKPTIASVSSNVFRVIICYALAATALGVTGVWWGIVAAMTLRSVWLLVWHRINLRKMPKEGAAEPQG